MPVGQLIRDGICRFLSSMSCLDLGLPTPCLRPGEEAV